LSTPVATEGVKEQIQGQRSQSQALPSCHSGELAVLGQDHWNSKQEKGLLRCAVPSKVGAVRAHLLTRDCSSDMRIWFKVTRLVAVHPESRTFVN
jgi:hypothetical protein